MALHRCIHIIVDFEIALFGHLIGVLIEHNKYCLFLLNVHAMQDSFQVRIS